ncbi:MAG: hypothetical protein CMF94_04120 [Candidatus Marinimicrobia bacterium]|nr:hypothetical protein [Candidatus Neomarinimicrobiota bacterium]
MLELAAAIVVLSIIAIGMTSGAQAVMYHYQSDIVRQDLRQYGNQIMREISTELNLAQKVEIDGQNGFSRIKLYQYFTDISPKLTISCKQRTGIEFNSDVPLNGVLNFPNEGVFRGPKTRSVYVDDFIAEFDMDGGPGLTQFKNSFIKLTLILSMDSDIMDENLQATNEEHIFYRKIFLGTPYIQNKMTNNMGGSDNV